MLLRNKKIVIIGGTSGIGLAAALAMQKAGAKLVIIGLEEASCEQAQAQLGTEVLVFQGDARGENTARKAIEQCLEIHGGFDGLYHVAGGSGRKFGDGPLHELRAEGWEKTMDLNCTAVMRSNQAAVQVLLENQTAGSIINLSSVLGYSPAPKFFYTHAYATAKSAVIGFSKAIASYYAQYNIRVNVIAPGLVATPMSQRAQTNEAIMAYVSTKQPLGGGRIGLPRDLDQLACLLLSDQAGFITGQVIAVDGGWSVSEG